MNVKIFRNYRVFSAHKKVEKLHKWRGLYISSLPNDSESSDEKFQLAMSSTKTHQPEIPMAAGLYKLVPNNHGDTRFIYC